MNSRILGRMYELLPDLACAVYRESCPTGLALAAFCSSHANVLAILEVQPTLALMPLENFLLGLEGPFHVGKNYSLTKFQLTGYLAGDAFPDCPACFRICSLFGDLMVNPA